MRWISYFYIFHSIFFIKHYDRLFTTITCHAYVHTLSGIHWQKYVTLANKPVCLPASAGSTCHIQIKLIRNKIANKIGEKNKTGVTIKLIITAQQNK